MANPWKTVKRVCGKLRKTRHEPVKWLTHRCTSTSDLTFLQESEVEKALLRAPPPPVEVPQEPFCEEVPCIIEETQSSSKIVIIDDSQNGDDISYSIEYSIVENLPMQLVQRLRESSIQTDLFRLLSRKRYAQVRKRGAVAMVFATSKARAAHAVKKHVEPWLDIVTFYPQGSEKIRVTFQPTRLSTFCMPTIFDTYPYMFGEAGHGMYLMDYLCEDLITFRKSPDWHACIAAEFLSTHSAANQDTDDESQDIEPQGGISPPPMDLPEASPHFEWHEDDFRARATVYQARIYDNAIHVMDRLSRMDTSDYASNPAWHSLNCALILGFEDILDLRQDYCMWGLWLIGTTEATFRQEASYWQELFFEHRYSIEAHLPMLHHTAYDKDPCWVSVSDACNQGMRRMLELSNRDCIMALILIGVESEVDHQAIVRLNTSDDRTAESHGIEIYKHELIRIIESMPPTDQLNRYYQILQNNAFADLSQEDCMLLDGLLLKPQAAGGLADMGPVPSYVTAPPDKTADTTQAVLSYLSKMAGKVLPDMDKAKLIAIVAATASLTTSLAGLCLALYDRSMDHYKTNLALWATNFVSSFTATLTLAGIHFKEAAAARLLRVIPNIFDTDIEPQSAGLAIESASKVIMVAVLGVLGVISPGVAKHITAFKTNAASVQTIFDTVAETAWTLAGLDLDGRYEFQLLINDLQKKAEAFLSKPSDSMTAKDLDEAQELQAEINRVVLAAPRSEKTVLITNYHAEMAKKIVATKQSQYARYPSPEPITVFWYGEGGIGKSTFVKTHLTAYLNKRFNVPKERGIVYNARITGQHFTRYDGNYWCVVDEIGNDKQTKNEGSSGATLNEMTSMGGSLIQGAHLDEKGQRSAFRLVSLISNKDINCSDLGLSPAGKEAFKTRVLSIHVTDPTYDKTKWRYAQDRPKGYKQLKFTLTDGTGTRKIGDMNVDQVMKYIEDRIVESAERAKKLHRDCHEEMEKIDTRKDGDRDYDLEIIPQNDSGPNVVSVISRPGTGKTTDWVTNGIPKMNALGYPFELFEGQDIQQGKTYIFDDLFDFTKQEDQARFSDLYNSTSPTTNFVVLCNYSPKKHSVFNPKYWVTNRADTDGTIEVPELRPGFYRRMGWATNAPRSRCYTKATGSYEPLFGGNSVFWSDIVTELVRGSTSSFVHIGSMPDAVEVDWKTADVYFYADTEYDVKSEELPALLYRNCKNLKLAKFLIRIRDMVDVNVNAFENLKRVFTTHHDFLRHFNGIVQIGDNMAILQAGHLYLTANTPIWSYDASDGVHFHKNRKTGETIPVSPEAYKKYRLGDKPDVDELQQVLMFKDYEAHHIKSALALEKAFPLTVMERITLMTRKNKERLGTMAEFVSRHSVLFGISALAIGATALYFACTKSKFPDEIRTKIGRKLRKVDSMTLAAINETIAAPYGDDALVELCEANGGIPAIYAEKKKGKNKGRRVGGRRKVKIGGKWYYEDEVMNDVALNNLYFSAFKSVKTGDVWVDEYDNYVSDFTHGGKGYRVTIGPNQSSIIIDEYFSAESSHLADELGRFVQGNLLHARCPVCHTGAFVYMLNDQVGVTPHHVYCQSHGLVHNDIHFEKLMEDEACERIFVKATKNGKETRVPGAKDVTEHLLGPDELSRVKKVVTFTVRDGKSVFSLSDFAYHRVIPNTFPAHFPKWVGQACSVYYGLTSCITAPGDCGSPYFFKDPNTNKWFLAGFHTGLQSTLHKLWGVVVTTHDIEQLNKYLSTPKIEPQAVRGNYVPIKGFSPIPDKLVYVHPDVEALIREPEYNDPGIWPHGPALARVGTIRNGIPWSPVTKRTLIEPRIDTSPIGVPKVPAMDETEALSARGDLFPPDAHGNKHQAYLRMIKGMKNTYDRFEHLEGRMCQAALRLASHDKIQYNIPSLTPLIPSTVLNGRKGQEKMKLDKSAGAISQILHGIHNKEGYFDIDDLDNVTFKMNHAGKWLERAVHDQHYHACRGNRVMYPSHATLKPELLDKAKCHKARIVQNSFITTLINMKRFTQPLAAAFNEQGPLTPYALALSPRVDFHLLAEDLLAKGSKFLDIDFSSFDLTVPAIAIQHALGSYMAYFYQDHKDFADIKAALQVYGQNVAYDPVLMGQSLMSKQGGVASGVESTSFIDSICTRMCLYLCYSWLKSGRDPHFKLALVDDFLEDIRTKSCGDDLLLVFAHGKEIPFEDWAEAFSTLFGMTITNPAKEEGVTSDYSTIRQVSFCSRTFQKIEGSIYWHSKLKPSATASSLTWTKIDESEPEAQFVQLEAALLEVFPYGRKIYNKVSQDIAAFARHHNIGEYSIASYDRIKEETIAMIKDSIVQWTQGRKPENELCDTHILDPRTFFSQGPKPKIELPSSKTDIKKKMTDNNNTPSAKAVMRSWRRQYLSPQKCTVEYFVTIPGATDVLEEKGPTQTVKVGGFDFLVPAKYSITCWQYIFETFDFPDVRVAAKLPTVFGRACQSLEDLRKSLNQVPECQTLDLWTMEFDCQAEPQSTPDRPLLPRAQTEEILKAFFKIYSTKCPMPEQVDGGVGGKESVDTLKCTQIEPQADSSQPVPQTAGTTGTSSDGTSVDSYVPPAGATQAVFQIQDIHDPMAIDAALTGGPGTKGTVALAVPGGIMETEDITQVGIKVNAASLAYQAQFVNDFVFTTEIDAGTVLWEIPMNPWSPLLAHADWLDWATLHERFVGGFDVAFDFTSTPGIYGKVQACFIPGQYVDDVQIREAELSRFRPVDMSLEKTQRINIPCRPVNPRLNKLLAVDRYDYAENEFIYGKVVIYTATRLGTIYGTPVPITGRVYTELAEDASFFKKDFTASSTDTTGYPLPFGPDGTFLVVDGPCDKISGNLDNPYWRDDGIPGPALVFFPPFNFADPLQKFDMMVAGYDSISPTYSDSQAYPNYGCAYNGIYTGKKSGVTALFKVGAFKNSGVTEPDYLTSKIQGRIEYAGIVTTKVGKIWAASSISGADYQLAEKSVDATGAALIIGEDVDPSVPGRYAHTAFSFTGGLSINLTSGGPGVVSLWNEDIDTIDQVAPTTENDAIYCTTAFANTEPVGRPANAYAVKLVPPTGIVPAVLSGARGHTIGHSVQDKLFTETLRAYFNVRPAINSLIYRATNAAGASVGQFVANEDGFWAYTNTQHGIFLDTLDTIRWEVSIGATKWPSISVSNVVDRTVSPYHSPPTFAFGKAKRLRYDDLPRKHKKQNDEGLPNLLKSCMITPQAAIVGAIGAGLNSAGNHMQISNQRSHELQMQENAIAAAKQIQQLKNQGQLKLAHAQIGKTARQQMRDSAAIQNTNIKPAKMTKDKGIDLSGRQNFTGSRTQADALVGDLKSSSFVTPAQVHVDGFDALPSSDV